MSPERQRGLVAECLLLRQLLSRAVVLDLSPDAVIEKWVQGRRDFFGGGVAIEVKSTAFRTRRHHIGSIEQLDSDPSQGRIFLYSVGLRHDPSVSGYLPDYVRQVRNQIVSRSATSLPAALEAFDEKIRSTGYDDDHEGLYLSGDGISQRTTLPPRLFDVEHIDRFRFTNLVGGELPRGVVSVSYDLEISGDQLTNSDANEVFDQLIGG
jgi:hypothetical protein